MANKDAPFGLKPYRHLNGSPWNGQVRKCYVSANYATAIFIGDCVDLDTTQADLDPTAKHMSVNRATVGDANRILGVVVGIQANPNDLSKQYLPASTGGYVYVAIANNDLTFICQDDGGAVPSYYSTNGLNAVLIDTHSGNTSTGLSGTELSMTTTPASNASYQLMVLNLADLPDNELAIHAIWEVLISIPRLGQCGVQSGAEGIAGQTNS